MEPKTDNSLEEVIYKPTTTNQEAPEILRASNKSSSCFLFTSASTANLIAFVGGITFSWTSPVIPRLNGSVDPANNPLGRAITISEESWIGALTSLGAAIGPVIAGSSADRIGRKRTLLFLTIPLIIAFFMTAYGKTVLIFYVARLVMGLGTGGVFAVLPMYLGEIAEDHNRGLLGCSLGVFVAGGVLFSFLIGPLMTVCEFSLLCLAPLTLFIPIFAIIIPESPVFLASKKQSYELGETLAKLRGRSKSQIDKEALELLEAAEKNDKKAGVLDLLKLRNLRKGSIIILGLILLQQFSGINVVVCYMQSIFSATGSEMAPETCAIVIGAVQLITVVFTSSVVEKLGRKILLLVSLAGCCASLVALGGFFYLKTQKYPTETISWLPVASLLVYIIAFNVGIGPLPWAIMAELFPSNARSTASSLVSFTNFFLSFVITLIFPPLSLMIGMGNSFWIFAGLCFFGFLFVYFVVPETKGKTLDEIQELLSGK